MRIGFDIDGIFAGFEDYFYEFLKRQCNLQLPAKEDLFSNYYWDQQLELSDEVKQDIDTYIWNDPNVWYRLPFLPSHTEIEMFNTLGLKHEIYFITARPSQSFKATLEWLYSNLGNTANFQLITGAKSKTKICQGLNIRHFLDDSIVNVYEATTYGISAYLFDNYCNRKYSKKTLESINETGIKVVNSLTDFFKTINSYDLYVS